MPDWHPIMSLDEFEPGSWLMYDARHQPFAVVRHLEIGGERGYRVVLWAQETSDRRLIGYWRTLRAAAMAAQQALASNGTPRRPRDVD